MSNHYRVVNLDPDRIDIEDQIIAAPSPEKAAAEVLGMELVRSGAKADLMAKVYWQAADGDPTNMVRLYKKVVPARPSLSKNNGRS